MQLALTLVTRYFCKRKIGFCCVFCVGSLVTVCFFCFYFVYFFLAYLFLISFRFCSQFFLWSCFTKFLALLSLCCRLYYFFDMALCLLIVFAIIFVIFFALLFFPLIHNILLSTLCYLGPHVACKYVIYAPTCRYMCRKSSHAYSTYLHFKLPTYVHQHNFLCLNEHTNCADKRETVGREGRII